MPLEPIMVRVPKETKDKIDRICAAKGITPSEYLREVLLEKLENLNPGPALGDKVSGSLDKYKALAERAVEVAEAMKRERDLFLTTYVESALITLDRDWLLKLPEKEKEALTKDLEIKMPSLQSMFIRGKLRMAQ